MDIIEEIIAKKPHLDNTLRFYERSIQFAAAVKALGIPSRPGLNAYPPEFIGRIIERFLTVVDLPEGSLSPLKQALELGEIDFTRLPLLEVPAFSLPYSEDDLTMLLFLLSRPYFLGIQEVLQRDDRFWEEGRCPVCSARPSLLTVSPKGLQQHCSFCGTKGRYDAVGCPVCHNKNRALLNTFIVKKEKGFRVRACDRCKSYVKTVDEKIMGRMTPDLADLMSLPLDVVVQEKGYKRPSPNPIGMLRMSASG
ncbi:MAG: formate dehydrogenase accessory protein FdhE [Nitrospirae bacterium]|nr:formate dehydrogenase accessory protein FdhE [Nitrospirota bacterium]